jgi:hypothetical protein
MKRIVILSLNALVVQIVRGNVDRLSDALFWLVNDDTGTSALKHYSGMVDEFLKAYPDRGVLHADDVMIVINKAIKERRLIWRTVGEFDLSQLSSLMKTHGFEPLATGSASHYPQIRRLVTVTNDGIDVHW